MSDEKTENVAQQLEPEPNSQTMRFYSNFAGIAATPEEFILRFGERDLKDHNKVIEAARVYLSFPHAKRLVIAMARSLKAHEEVFGEIIPDPITGLSAEVKKKLGIEDSEKQ